MFKTIEECGLTLVSYTGANVLELGYKDGSVDFIPVSAARASFGKQDKTGENPEADTKLMHYLADHRHLTPFEYQHATFLIECPLFIRSQIHRHRTFSYNEISRRYTSENLEFWMPDTWRGQSKNNKQASEDRELPQYMYTEEAHGVDETPSQVMEHTTAYLISVYEDMLVHGICREQARAVLPQSLLTRFYMGGNLRNWAHFVELRRDGHAQYEVQVIANRIADALRQLWPTSCAALKI